MADHDPGGRIRLAIANGYNTVDDIARHLKKPPRVIRAKLAAMYSLRQVSKRDDKFYIPR